MKVSGNPNRIANDFNHLADLYRCLYQLYLADSSDYVRTHLKITFKVEIEDEKENENGYVDKSFAQATLTYPRYDILSGIIDALEKEYRAKDVTKIYDKPPFTIEVKI